LIQRVVRIIRYRPGHLGNIYIIYAKNTKDEVWLNNATQKIDPANIKYYSLKEKIPSYAVKS